MKQLTCEMCGSTDLLKQDGVFVCQSCGTKYSIEDAKKMMVEGTVNVQGAVSIDLTEKQRMALDRVKYKLLKTNYQLRGLEYWYCQYENSDAGINDILKNVLKEDPGNYEANFLQDLLDYLRKYDYSKMSNPHSGIEKLQESLSFYPDDKIPEVKKFMEEFLINSAARNRFAIEALFKNKEYSIIGILKMLFGDYSNDEIRNIGTTLVRMSFDKFLSSSTVRSSNDYKDISELQEYNSLCNRFNVILEIDMYKKLITYILGRANDFINEWNVDRYNSIRYPEDCGNGSYTKKAKLFCIMLSDLIMLYHQKIKVQDSSYVIPERPVFEVKKKACYVATAVYGSYDCPEVWTLRRYRDFILAETWYGRAFINTYYTISPTLVKWFGQKEWFKKMWRGKLNRMVKKLQSKGLESTPYQDKNW